MEAIQALANVRGKRAPVELCLWDSHLTAISDHVDIQIPGRDGMAARPALRSLGHNETPIIAMTTHALKGECERIPARSRCDITRSLKPGVVPRVIGRWILQEDT